jgi:hypothetical protein
MRRGHASSSVGEPVAPVVTHVIVSPMLKLLAAVALALATVELLTLTADSPVTLAPLILIATVKLPAPVT